MLQTLNRQLIEVLTDLKEEFNCPVFFLKSDFKYLQSSENEKHKPFLEQLFSPDIKKVESNHADLILYTIDDTFQTFIFPINTDESKIGYLSFGLFLINSKLQNKELIKKYKALNIQSNLHEVEKKINENLFAVKLVQKTVIDKIHIQTIHNQQSSIAQKLQESQKRYINYFQSNPTPSFVWKKDNFHFILFEINQAAYKYTYGKAIDYIGKTATEIYPDRPDIVEHLKQCYEKKLVFSHEFEYQIRNNQQKIYVHFKYVYSPPDRVILHVEDISNQKRYEKTLIENEKKLSKILDVFPQFISYTDKNLIYQFVNKTYKERFNTKAEDIIGKSIIDIIGKETYNKTKEKIEKVLNGENIRYLENFRYPNEQNESYIDGNLVPDIASSGEVLGYYAILTDITPYIKVQKELEEQKKWLNNILETTNAGYFYLDTQGTYQKVNKAWLKMHGFRKEEEIIGKSYHYTLEESELGKLKKFEKILQQGKSVPQAEFSRKKKDGSIAFHNFTLRPVIKNKKIVGIEGFMIDTTEAKLATKALRDSEQKYRMLFEQMVSGFAYHKIIYDNNKKPIDYLFIDVNPAFEKLTGFSRKEIIGKTLLELMPQTKKYWIKNYEKVANSKKPLRFEQYLGVINRFFEVIAYSPQDNYFAVILKDITQQRKMMTELINAKEKAEAGNKLKNAFLQNISHEIRTPMNSIVGFSDLLKNPKLSKDRIKKYSDFITKSTQQLLKILDDIIRISIIETGNETLNLSKFNVNQLIKEIYAKFIEKAQNKNINFYQQLTSNKTPIASDYQKLKEILSNLIDNAIKFTEKGSVEISYKLKNEHVNFCIKDTGIGIDCNEQNTIFQHFYQVETGTTRKYGGNGLGLSIVLAYVKFLNGSIKIESELNKGTTFIISIPVTAKDITNNEIVQENIKAPNLEGLTVLIAEDEDVNYEFLYELLTETKAHILKAEDGNRAINLIRNYPVDLILMDLNMPNLDGIEATKIIKKLNRKIPIIALTAYVTSENKATAIGVGCDAYIAKPIDREELFMYIKKLLSSVLKS